MMESFNSPKVSHDEEDANENFIGTNLFQKHDVIIEEGEPSGDVNKTKDQKDCITDEKSSSNDVTDDEILTGNFTEEKKLINDVTEEKNTIDSATSTYNIGLSSQDATKETFNSNPEPDCRNNLPEDEMIKFATLFSGLKENTFLRKSEKTDWVDYLERAQLQHNLRLDANFLNCFAFENESEYSNLTYRHLWSIVDDSAWLEDAIINALIGNRCKNVKKVGYIETSVFESIENPHLSETVQTPLKDEKDGYVAVKNSGGNHWVFVYISFKDHTFYVADPKYETSEAGMKEIFESLKRCHHSEKNSKLESKWNLKSGSWKMKQIKRSVQRDDHNCGVFCVKFAFQVVKSFPNTPKKLTVERNLSNARQLFTALVLRSSKKIMSTAQLSK